MAKLGTHLNNEVKAKIRAKLLGRRCSMKSEWAKGHIPFNKGIKGTHFSPKTEFKKGHIPANYQNGYKLSKDGIYLINRKKKYSYMYKGKKVIANNYEQLARVKYRKAFGKFDKNLIIFHKDGDIYNNEIDNLELITRKELLKRNSMKNPIKKLCVICGKEFFAKSNYVLNCSKECIKKYNHKKSKEYSKTHRDIMNLHNQKYKQRLREN